MYTIQLHTIYPTHKWLQKSEKSDKGVLKAGGEGQMGRKWRQEDMANDEEKGNMMV